MRMTQPEARTATESYSRVHDYIFGETISKSPYSTLRVAFQNGIDKPMVVKIISKAKMKQLTRGNQIIFNETILSPLIYHENIVPILNVTESDSHLFQIMGRVGGGDLLHRLRNTILPVETAVRAMRQILSAVEFLHSLGICHRDIKLENVLITKKENFKLCDFGLATITFDGTLSDHCGSYEYAAPEAIDSPQFDGFKADMWGCGIIFYVLFSRKLPFQSATSGTNFGLPIDLSPIPQEFQPLIQSLLSTDPQMRMSATEALAFPALGVNPQSKHPPSSIISEPIKEDGDSEMVFSRLSQITNVPAATIKSVVLSPTPTIHKLLYVLIKRRYDFSQQNGIEIPFKKGLYPHTMPSSSLKEIKRRFNAPSSSIVNSMKDFLIHNKCYVASPIADFPSIILNCKSSDKKVLFQCNELQSDGGCSLMLYGDDESSDITGAIIKHLEKRFPPSM